MSCIVDGDCPTTFVCYSNISWFIPSSGFNDTGCLCSTWYGYSGLNCETSIGPTSDFHLASSILNIIACVVFLFFALKNVLNLIRGKAFNLTSATSIANVQLIFSFILIGSSQVFWAIESKSPGTNFVVPKPGNDKIQTTHVIRQILFILGILTTVLAALTVALVWVDVAEKAKRLAKVGTVTQIPKTRRGLLIFELLIAIGFFVSAGLFLSSIAVGIGLVIIITTMIVYLVGFISLSNQLKSLTSSEQGHANGIKNDMYRSVILEIRKTAAAVVIVEIIMIILCLILIVLNENDWKEGCLPGQIPSIIVTWQLLAGSIIGVDIVVYFAIRKATKRVVGNSDSNSSSNHLIQEKSKPGSFYKPSAVSRNNSNLKQESIVVGTNHDFKSPVVSTEQQVAAYQIDRHL